MTWTDDFLKACLNGLPRDKYRDRARAELNDHLLNLAQDLEDSGLSPKEAQARALTLMGAPGELNGSFRAEWVRRASHWKYGLVSLFKGALHCVLVNVLVRWMLVMPVTIFGRGILIGWIEDGGLLPIVAFTLGNVALGLWFTAHEMGERFLLHPRRGGFIFFGCLLAWLWDVSPFLINESMGFPGDICTIFAIPVFLGQLPLLLLFQSSNRYVISYFGLSLLSALAFGVFYRRPKITR